MPRSFKVGLVGLQTQLGVQFSHLIGLYVVSEIDGVFGKVGGVHLVGALMLDFSINDHVKIGFGGEGGGFGALSVASTSVATAGGLLAGGRLHFGFQPVASRGANGIRRKALSIGVDLRFLGGGAGYAAASADLSSATVAASAFVFSPMVSIGYLAF